MSLALALADCGPCAGTGALVRDHLPPDLSPDARAFILTRLAHGEAIYGAPLRIGWAPAGIELPQEIGDGVAYGVAAGVPAWLLRDLCAALETALRLAAGPSAPRRRLRVAGWLRSAAAWLESL